MSQRLGQSATLAVFASRAARSYIRIHSNHEAITTMTIRTVTTQEFFQQLDERIAEFDLLCHPFYKAWSAGELSRDNLREYARDYYHHVDAFPAYLAELSMRLEESELRRAVLTNLMDEKGGDDADGKNPEHADLWLDFVEGMGASRDLRGHRPIAEIEDLMSFFHGVASEGAPEEALAAFYAYESQVPRVATEKERGLREIYGADSKTCGYFILHSTADVVHSQIWKQQLARQVEGNPQAAERVLTAAGNAAKALWSALDGIESRRMAKAA
jgi:pyrroloquinoline-quinone synthase